MSRQCPQGLTDEQAEEYIKQVEGFLKYQNQSARIAELECEIQSLREAYCGAIGDKRMYKKRCQPYEHVMRRSQICGNPDFCIKCGKEELNNE